MSQLSYFGILVVAVPVLICSISKPAAGYPTITMENGKDFDQDKANESPTNLQNLTFNTPSSSNPIQLDTEMLLDDKKRDDWKNRLASAEQQPNANQFDPEPAPSQPKPQESQFLDTEGSGEGPVRPLVPDQELEIEGSGSDDLSINGTQVGADQPLEYLDEFDGEPVRVHAWQDRDFHAKQYGTIIGFDEDMNDQLKHVNGGDEIITLWINLNTGRIVGSTLKSLDRAERALLPLLGKERSHYVSRLHGK